jgi:hypothetical protein
MRNSPLHCCDALWVSGLSEHIRRQGYEASKADSLKRIIAHWLCRGTSRIRNPPPRRTLQQPRVLGSLMILGGGGLVLMSQVPL